MLGPSVAIVDSCVITIKRFCIVYHSKYKGRGYWQGASLSIILYWQGLSLSIISYWQGGSLSIISYWQGYVPVTNFLLTGTVPVNNFLLTGTFSFKFLFYCEQFTGAGPNSKLIQLFLAGMSSSRSDNVTHSVRSPVRPSVRPSVRHAFSTLKHLKQTLMFECYKCFTSFSAVFHHCFTIILPMLSVEKGGFWHNGSPTYIWGSRFDPPDFSGSGNKDFFHTTRGKWGIWPPKNMIFRFFHQNFQFLDFFLPKWLKIL